MRIRVFDSDRTLASNLAALVAAALAADPDLVLGLPTGRTPILLYAELVRLASRGGVDFSRATTFNLDEFLGIEGSHPASYRQFMERHLFAHVNLPSNRVNFLDGAAPDVEAECDRYERAIRRAGGIGLQLVGIGSNGHIGFNEPAPQLMARTHAVTLKPETRRANAALFEGDIDRVPRQALSMGMGTILRARSIVLIATGESKAACVRGMIEGPLTTALPASFLQVHRDAEVWIDRAAAGQLTQPADHYLD